MTLERHRSHLIPDVNYSLDGTLFVTDTGGTFPLSGKGKTHKDIRDHGFQPVESAPSYLSYDPRRDEKKRMYKQRNSPNRYGQEIQNISGYSTISTNASSLGRRLRRSKRRYSSVRGQEYRYSRNKRNSEEFHFKENGYNSLSAGSTGRRLRGGIPRMTPEFAETLKRKKTSRSLDLKEIKNESPYDIKRRNSYENSFGREHRQSNRSIKSLTEKQRLRKIHDETLPYLPFLIDGVFLVVVGIVRIVMSYWHEYFCALWVGLFSIFVGIIGAKHKGLYLAKGINAAYILFGFVLSALLLLSSSFVLSVFIPTVTLLADNTAASDVITQVTFTNLNRTVVNLSISPSAMLWTSLALDLATIIFIFVGFFSVMAAMIALSNHWDASYDTTADCDHRGNPRLFNPIEQVSLGEATVFMGLVYTAAESGYQSTDHNNFYLSVVAGALIMLSGVLSFCFGKRTDMLAMGTFACFFELLSFAACCGATVLAVLGIVEDATAVPQFSNTDSRAYNEHLGMVIIGGGLVIVLSINIIFIVGTVFRQFRQVCCRDCCREPDDDADSYGNRNSRLDNNSMDRRRR